MFNRKAIIFFILAGASVLIGFLANLYLDRLHSPIAIAEVISNRLSDEIEKTEVEGELLVSTGSESAWENLKYSFFLYDSSSVVRWNKNDYLPDIRLVQEDFKIKFFQSSRGSFVVRKWKLRDDSTLVSCIPIFEKYSISNRYLVPSWNVDIFSGDGVELLEAVSSEGYPITCEGTILFKVKFSSTIQDQYQNTDTISLLCGWLALVFAAFGLWFLVFDCHKRGNFTLAFFTLLIGLVLIRYVMISFNFPRDYSKLYIFDPLQFASSSLNPSIADLFFNTVSALLLGLYFFNTYFHWSIIREIDKLNRFYKFLISVGLLLICFYSILFPFLFFETISHNSSISLDISQTINFDLTRSLAFLSIVLGSVCAFLFCHASFKIATLAVRQSGVHFYVALLLSAFFFLVIYEISGRNYLITLICGLAYFSVLFLVDWRSSLKRFSFATFLYFFLSIIVLSIQGSVSIKRFAREKTIEDQVRYGSNFLVGRDNLGEYLLSEAAQRISSDPFIQSRMATPFLAKSGVRQKVYQVHLNAYFDKYEVQVYLYNASGESHDNIARLNFATLINEFQKEENKTNYEGVYFIESENPESAKRYLIIAPIDQYGTHPIQKSDRYVGKAGFVVLDLSLKKLIPQNVFPELLVDNQFFNYYRSTDFSYAFFLKGRLMSSSGTYNYERDFSPELLGKGSLYKTGVAENGCTHIGLEDDLGRIAVVSAPNYTWFNVLANFSFLFMLGLCFVLFLLLFFGIVSWQRGERLNYAARIQVYVYLAFLLPLISVSITTLSLISRSEESELKKEYLNKSKIIGDRLSNELDAYTKREEDTKADFDSQLLNLTKLANLDASVFSTNGKLISSSQPLIYQNQLVSNLIDKKAWSRIVEGKETSFVENDAIGKLTFNTSYAALKSQESGKLIGILSIPFFDSEHSLEKTQISVLVNILVVFVIVFLLFSLISFFIINWLTFPLRFITRSLGKTSFSGDNKPLAWKSSDEIGLLVSGYNRMIENLALSKIELMRTEKDQ
jgi:two-component system, NtrC family, nitrogen regulation sensor histidine kinase NtrY